MKIIKYLIIILGFIGIVLLIYFTKTAKLECTKDNGKIIIYKIGHNGIRDINYNGTDFDATQVKVLRKLLDSKIDRTIFINKKRDLLRQYEESLDSVCK